MWGQLTHSLPSAGMVEPEQQVGGSGDGGGDNGDDGDNDEEETNEQLILFVFASWSVNSSGDKCIPVIKLTAYIVPELS